MVKEKPLLRKDVPLESIWNRELLFASWADWQATLERAQAELPQIAAFQNRLHQGPAILLDWFEEYGRQWDRVLRLSVFANLSVSVDSSDEEAKAHQGQIFTFWSQFDAAAAFAESEFLAMPQMFLDWCTPDAKLAGYRHYFSDLIRIAKHRRSAEIEEILGMLQAPFFNVVITARVLTNTDMKFADAVDNQGHKHPVNQATQPPTGIQSADRSHRRTAWESFCDSHLALQNSLASNYLTRVKQMVTLAKIRGYESVLAMMLAPSNLPVSVFHNVINTFKAQKPVWHRYWDVKRRFLGLDAFHPYDIWAPLVANEPAIPFRQAVEWICESLTPLGEPYVKIIRQGCLVDRWVDYAPNVEKEQGAASFWPTANMPAFIFCGYDESVTGMSILAHELGHSLHFFLTANNQPQAYGFERMSSAVTETASNFHQAMLRAHLSAVMADDRAFRIALLEESLYNFHRYFFIMPTLAEFEWEVYSRAEQNQPLSAATLNQIMAEKFAEGYGRTMVDDPCRTQITWAQFSHLYRPFYTFQYAAGIAAAHALAKGMLNNGPAAAKRYLQFLKVGSSMYPAQALALAGVDMTSPAPVEEAFSTLSNTISRLEALIP